MAKQDEGSSDEEFFDCVENITVKYYSLAFPKDRGRGVVFTDMKDAFKKWKEVKGTRFKTFSTLRDARDFADTPSEDLSSPRTKEKPKLRRDVDPFPNVSQRDLNCLKSAIEAGDLDAVRSRVWNNPRHLVTESDSPTVLQVRFRYNALHVAAKSGSAEIIAFLLFSMSGLDFWKSLHPSADLATNMERRDRIVDMYLNGPETGNLETPLHFASKFGHASCVRALMSHELTQPDPLNKEGHTPTEIACERFGGENNELETRRMDVQLAVNERYVVLVDNEGPEGGLPARVLHPMAWPELRERLEAPGSGKGGQERVRAYAGPMTPDQAKAFYEEWCTPTRVKRDVFAQMKLTDDEKGFERMGRFLAKKYGVDWREYWGFLSTFLNLSTDEGLNRLEQHLTVDFGLQEVQNGVELEEEEEYSDALDDESSLVDVRMSKDQFLNALEEEGPLWRYRDPTPEVPSGDEITDNSSHSACLDGTDSPKSHTNSGMLGSLVWLFSKLSIVSPIRLGRSSPPLDVTPEDQILPSNVLASTPLRAGKPTPAFQSTPVTRERHHLTPRRLRRSVGRSGLLTRDDVHVMRALHETTLPERFVCVRQWKEDLERLDELHDLSGSFHQQRLSKSVNDIGSRFSYAAY